MLCITADNSYRLFLDGRELGRATEWKSLTDYELSWVLKPGTHVIGVETGAPRADAGHNAEHPPGSFAGVTTTAALEYYLGKVGLLSVTGYQRDIDGFIISARRPADAAFLDAWALSDDYAGYEVATQVNSPTSRP